MFCYTRKMKKHEIVVAFLNEKSASAHASKMKKKGFRFGS